MRVKSHDHRRNINELHAASRTSDAALHEFGLVAVKFISAYVTSHNLQPHDEWVSILSQLIPKTSERWSAEMGVPYAGYLDAAMRYRHYRLTSKKNRKVNEIADKTVSIETVFESSITSDGSRLLSDDDELVSTVYRALATMNSDDQEIIKGRYFQGRTLHDLAKEMGVSHQTVDNRAKKAMERLRKLLKEID